MIPSLNTGVSGLQQYQNRLDILGNNIANANTIGYKSARLDSADTFSQTLSAATSGPIQVGTGVGAGTIRSNQADGVISNTGLEGDLAISGGDGYFLVKDTVTSDMYATRAGDFSLDPSGYLVTPGGQRVQGFTDGTLATRGDIKIDATGKPTGSGDYKSFTIDQQGTITVNLTDGQSFVRGQVLLQRFETPDNLTKAGNNLYSGLANGTPLGTGLLSGATPPGTFGTGDIKQGALEQSNVDLTTEFANMITAQRGFQANARVITTSDEVLQEIVSLKR